MTLLKPRMMQDLKLAGHAPKTQKTYLECVGLFAQFCWEPGQAEQQGLKPTRSIYLGLDAKDCAEALQGGFTRALSIPFSVE